MVTRGRRAWSVAAPLLGLGVIAAGLWARYGRDGGGILRAVRGGFVRPGSLVAALAPAPDFAHPVPKTPAAARALRLLSQVEGNQRRGRYQHRTEVYERTGDYRWDCSGMTAWILARSAPRARRSLGEGRVIARGFARRIARAPRSRGRGGWQQVDHIRDVRPGDIFAWERPPGYPSRNSGHVGFFAYEPVEVADGVWAARVIDATALPHQDDTREQGASGIGRGTMTFAVDADGHAVAYGWHGTRSLGLVETRVYFGRLR